MTKSTTIRRGIICSGPCPLNIGATLPDPFTFPSSLIPPPFYPSSTVLLLLESHFSPRQSFSSFFPAHPLIGPIFFLLLPTLYPLLPPFPFLFPLKIISTLCAALEGSRLLHNVIRGHATSCPSTFRTHFLTSFGGDQSIFQTPTKEKRLHPSDPDSRTRFCFQPASRSLREPFTPLLARIRPPSPILRGAYLLGRVPAVAFDLSSH